MDAKQILATALSTRQVNAKFDLKVIGIAPHPEHPHLYAVIVNATLRYTPKLNIHVAEFTINVDRRALDNTDIPVIQRITDKVTKAISHGLYDFILERALRKPIDEIITDNMLQEPTPTSQSQIRRLQAQRTSANTTSNKSSKSNTKDKEK